MFFLFHCHINVCLLPLKLYYIISTLSWPPFLLRLWGTLTSSFPFHRFTQLFARLLLNPLFRRYVFLCLFLVIQRQYISFFQLLPTSRWSPRGLGPALFALLPLNYLCVPSAFLHDTCPDFFLLSSLMGVFISTDHQLRSNYTWREIRHKIYMCSVSYYIM